MISQLQKEYDALEIYSWRSPEYLRNLVTAPVWPAHSEWLKKFLDVLGTKIEP